MTKIVYGMEETVKVGEIHCPNRKCRRPTPRKRLQMTAYGLRCPVCRDRMHRSKRQVRQVRQVGKVGAT